MVEKKNRKNKNELTGYEKILPVQDSVVAVDSVDVQHRLGAVAFVEHIAEEHEDNTNIFSLETLRDAFSNLAGDERKVENEEEPDDETFALDETNESLSDTEIVSDLESDAEQTVDLSPKTILEAMLFVGNRDNRPLSAVRAAEKMRNVTPEEIEEMVILLNQDYQQLGCPYTIRKESDGYRMVLRSEFEPILVRFYGKTREAKLSQQTIDTLAVVAYRQPISAEEVQKIRRQPSSMLLNQLVRRGLLGVEREIRDKKKILLYRTTNRFLELFQLNSINDLPISEEIEFR
ncbi:MAG: SMC-Scp complex subunit ScpB [Planctomycetaceae bacterium]|jgi:segregation and condensation protein B|nr:SMC-Scp complex subunit ScpB [Planctomycetaceae bacterium]